MCNSQSTYYRPPSHRLGFWDGVLAAAVPAVLLVIMVEIYVPADQERVEAQPSPPPTSEDFFYRSLSETHQVVELCGGIEAKTPTNNVDTMLLLRHVRKALRSAYLVNADGSFEWDHQLMRRYFDVLVPALEAMIRALDARDREQLADAFRLICGWDDPY